MNNPYQQQQQQQPQQYPPHLLSGHGVQQMQFQPLQQLHPISIPETTPQMPYRLNTNENLITSTNPKPSAPPIEKKRKKHRSSLGGSDSESEKLISRKKKKQKREEMMKMISMKGQLAMVPLSETNIIKAALAFPTDGLSKLDKYRIENVDREFVLALLPKTIVQKALQERINDFKLSYYWVFSRENVLSVNKLANLKHKFGEYIIDMEFNPSGNTCQMKFNADFGTKTNCFCDKCRDFLERALEKPLGDDSGESEKNNNDNGNNTSYDPSSPIIPLTNACATNYNGSPSMYSNVPMYCPIQTSQGLQYIPQTTPYIVTHTNNSSNNQTQFFSSQKQQKPTLFPLTEGDEMSMNCARFWIYVKKATDAENRSYKPEAN